MRDGAGRQNYSCLRAGHSFSRPAPEILEDLARTDGKGEEPLVLDQDLFQRCTVVDDDIIFGKKGLGKMPAVFATEDHYLVKVSMELDVGPVDQFFFGHGAQSQ